jgi:hypothetical protein
MTFSSTSSGANLIHFRAMSSAIGHYFVVKIESDRF